MTVRDKIKICSIGIIMGILGCTFYIKYESDVGLDVPIEERTRIKIKGGTIKSGSATYIADSAIVKDLKKNVFPNVVERDYQVLCIVDINRWTISDEPWGFLWFPLVYLGAPLSKTKSDANISLRICKPDATLVREYNGTSHKEQWTGLYYNTNSNSLSLKDAMEKIKRDMNSNRAEIVAAIRGREESYEEAKEIVKPSPITSPPRLVYNYSLVDQNNNRILDGGEKISLKVRVQNQGEGTAKGVKILLSGNSKALNYLGKEKYLGDIQPNTQKSATFEVVLPYQIELDEGSIIIKVTEVQGFGALKEKELRVAMQPAKVRRETEVISMLVDVDQPLTPTSFKRDDSYAVIIGITDYRSSKIPKVKYAKKDAQIVKEYFVNVCGIPEANIISLIDDKATGTDLIAYIEEWLPRNVSKNSFVFVYFAGHGTPNPESGDAYLVPYDGEPGFISKLYPLKRLYNSLENLPTEDIVVALDACFSGAGGRSVIEEGKRPLVAAKIPRTTKKVAVITASDADEISQDLDTKRHGVFTYYFLKGLRGEADKNFDGWVTLGELYNYCKPKIATESRRLGYTQTIQVFPKPLGKKVNLRIGKVR